METSPKGSEEIFHALQEFSETPQSLRQLSQPIEDLLESVAKTGELDHPWNLVRPAIHFKLHKVLGDFFESTNYPDRTEAEREHAEMKATIFDRLLSFDRAPFTLQRLCELVVWPQKHYTRCDKYMRGVIKVVKVVSTIGSPICNGSSHSLTADNCNGNSPMMSRLETSSTGEPSNMNMSSGSLSLGEADDSFSSFNLSPRQMPSPYSPPLSPVAGVGRALDDRPTWRSPTNDTATMDNDMASIGTESSDSDGSLDNTQSTVDLSEGASVSPSPPGHTNGVETKNEPADSNSGGPANVDEQPTVDSSTSNETASTAPMEPAEILKSEPVETASTENESSSTAQDEQQEDTKEPVR
ncbi:serine/threonine-protein phosphatase 4 regulatory subunit 2-like [Sycon ciliatum]|uniref:serine/threonine-protein phosphatase 4 regulatory subunit 2-like n=1 Tax=Sycon ciliatum TaxID=27933 RepID=UPI0020ABF800|eukprot:scpid47524/ scgid32107/ Serine/threonine-protein phosphatase 4 regulatory subunit 2; PPP4R2-related protein